VITSVCLSKVWAHQSWVSVWIFGFFRCLPRHPKCVVLFLGAFPEKTARHLALHLHLRLDSHLQLQLHVQVHVHLHEHLHLKTSVPPRYLPLGSWLWHDFRAAERVDSSRWNQPPFVFPGFQCSLDISLQDVGSGGISEPQRGAFVILPPLRFPGFQCHPGMFRSDLDSGSISDPQRGPTVGPAGMTRIGVLTMRGICLSDLAFWRYVRTSERPENSLSNHSLA